MDAPLRTSFESVVNNTNDTSSQKHRRYDVQEDQSSSISDESESCNGIPSNSSNSIESSSLRLRQPSSLRCSNEFEHKFKQIRRYS